VFASLGALSRVLIENLEVGNGSGRGLTGETGGRTSQRGQLGRTRRRSKPAESLAGRCQWAASALLTRRQSRVSASSGWLAGRPAALGVQTGGQFARSPLALDAEEEFNTGEQNASVLAVLSNQNRPIDLATLANHDLWHRIATDPSRAGPGPARARPLDRRPMSRRPARIERSIESILI
jgi:hypothetical protein